jgi:hypothetical protein
VRPLYRLIVTGPEPTALEQVGQAVPELVAGAAGGLVGYALGGPAGAATGGALTPAMVTAWNVGGLALVHRLSRGSRALDVAADELDVGLDILTERATADEPRLELLARVLEAAGRTSLDKKIPALGRVSLARCRRTVTSMRRSSSPGGWTTWKHCTSKSLERYEPFATPADILKQAH